MTGASRALARRYARALLEVASREGAGPALALRDELRAFGPVVDGHPRLRRALLHPGLGTEARRRVLAAVAEGAGASALLRRVLELLASRDRVSLLPDLIEAYGALANVAHGVVPATVVSAAPLAEAQGRALAAALGGAVELQSRVDPAVVGGLLVQVGGTTYDGTVRTRLAALRRRLAGASPGASGRAS
ncbi:MAG TPA: ATP synthase F1 subunit delta [Vicinamibacteria bacterium]|nr:ATP synthase F1 subunit delta [Vicinamibacteria bacterium]